MKRYLVLTAAALLSGAAFAQTQEGTASSPFDLLDADRSGGISEEEAQAHPTVSGAFRQADANSDGIITREEFDNAFTTEEPVDRPPIESPPIR